MRRSVPMFPVAVIVALLLAVPLCGDEASLPAYALLGETRPGPEPVRFGAGFMRGAFHSSPVFAPDGLEAWWAGSYATASIYTSRWTGTAWSPPAEVRFSGRINSYRDPFVSPDGLRFYFISEAALPGEPYGGKENIWFMRRIGQAWSEPEPLPAPVNSLQLHWTLSVSSGYDLYFSARGPGGDADLFVAQYIDGAYREPVLLPRPVNSHDEELTPNISPDGLVLLFSRMGPSGVPRLYVTYRSGPDWSAPALVENVPYCIAPVVTPDRRYLVFMSAHNAFSWRDASFIDELKPRP